MNSVNKDATPAGNFMKSVWAFCKQHALTFAVGVASGVGITIAVQAAQGNNEVFTTVEDEATIQ